MCSRCVCGATCSESSTDAKISINAYRCACALGFTNGACVPGFIAQYKTQCSVLESSGVASGNCDVDVDECASKPCLHNAQCINSGITNMYTCKCVAGYANPICEYDTYARATTCTPVLVDDGMSGGNCEMDIDECASTPCANGGKCSTPVVGKYMCTCLGGFQGVNCAVNIDECASTPCKNGAVCADYVDAWKCDCVDIVLGGLAAYEGEFLRASDLYLFKNPDRQHVAGQT